MPHWTTHQLWGSGVSCWWSAREKPKKVPRSPNLCSVWVVSRLKPRTWLKRVNRAQRMAVQGWEEHDERETVFPCPTGAAIARCRASSVQEVHRGRPFYGSQWAKREKSCAVSSPVLPSVDASLVSDPLSPLPALYPAGSQLRLLLSVWRAGCENVAATSLCVCECVSLNACAPPPPLSSEGDRGQVPWIARSLLPFPSLFQSPPPTPLPSLSWHQHSRDCCQNTRQGCQDTWRLLNRGRGWKDSRLFYLLSSHGPNCFFLRPLAGAGASWSEEHKREKTWGTILKVKRPDGWKIERFFFTLSLKALTSDFWWQRSGMNVGDKRGRNVHSDPANFITDLLLFWKGRVGEMYVLWQSNIHRDIIRKIEGL